MIYTKPNSDFSTSYSEPLRIDSNSSSESVVGVSLSRYIYDIDKILEETPEIFNFTARIYNPPVSQSVSANEVAVQPMVSLTTIEVNPETISDAIMTRDVIIELRIKNGEGTSESQFSKEFPYERI